jgi:hypothetical protein
METDMKTDQADASGCCWCLLMAVLAAQPKYRCGAYLQYSPRRARSRTTPSTRVANILVGIDRTFAARSWDDSEYNGNGY